MSCKCSPSLLKLRDQLDAAYPDRDKAADGCCGDARHSGRISDHNPNVSGYAHAFDITASPPIDMDRFADRLLADDRATYIIWNRRIAVHNDPRGWRAYTGANAHTGHLHLSIRSDATFDERPWPVTLIEEEDDLTPEQEATLQQAHDAIARLETARVDDRHKIDRMSRDLYRLKLAVGLPDAEPAGGDNPKSPILEALK